MNRVGRPRAWRGDVVDHLPVKIVRPPRSTPGKTTGSVTPMGRGHRLCAWLETPRPLRARARTRRRNDDDSGAAWVESGNWLGHSTTGRPRHVKWVAGRRL